MPSKIRVLSEKAINEIAAGEVIEGPASVVKELVENAVDAGSKKVTIEIQGGGHGLIRIIDDGEGMSRDDAVAAFERHATSKLKEAKELLGIATMGFRGEALASIASIAKVELITSDGGVGAKVVINGGRYGKIEAAGRDRGTTLSIRSLFYNTPARRKFQKGQAASTQEIRKILNNLALAHKGVAFHFIANEKTQFKTTRSCEKRVGEVFGEPFLEELKQVDVKYDGMHLSGWIGSPSRARSSRLGQYLFVNKRPIYALLISNAVRAAYGTSLSRGEHPIFLLWCEIDSKKIDVNVHPQKKEIRFQDEEEVYRKVKTSIEKVLLSHLGDQSFVEMPSTKSLFAGSSVSLDQFTSLREQAKTYQGFRKNDSSSEPWKPIKTANLPEVDINREESLLTLSSISIWGIEGHITIGKKEGGFSGGSREQEWRLFIADLSQIEALFCYQSILESLEKGVQIGSQGLLIPEKLECHPDEEEILRKEIETFQIWGIEIKPFGKQTFLIEALPNFLETEACKKLIFEWIHLDAAERDPKEVAKRLLGYRRNKRVYSQEEAESLLKRFWKQPSPSYYAPSGKGTVVLLSEQALEKLFTKACSFESLFAKGDL